MTVLDKRVILLAFAATALSLVPAQAAEGPESTINDRAQMVLAYEGEAGAGRFDAALRHAVAGCEQLQLVSLCREVADLPLQMAERGIAVSAQYTDALRRVGDAVCLSERPFLNSDGLEVRGFICSYFAQQYAGTHNPVRARLFDAGVRQYLESMRDPDYARRLYQVACQHSYANATCETIHENQFAGRAVSAP